MRIAGKGTITMVYDADGNKLQKTFMPEAGGTAKTTTYINEFIYEGDALQYINFEEGRVRVMQAVSQNNGFDILTIDGNLTLPIPPLGGGGGGAFDYFLRDYQGNVRMILTEETHLGSNSCTMETARAANEEPLFGQVDASGVPTAANEVKARFAVSSIPGQSSGGGWQSPAINSYVSRVGNLASSKMGPNALLKVMGGDKVSATSIYYYQNPVVNTSTNSNTLLTSLLQSLAGAITGSGTTPSSIKNAAGNITTQLSSNAPFVAATSTNKGSFRNRNPKAFLTVLFFDERFNFVEESSQALRVTQSGNNAPALVLANIKAPKNGYAYVYVSNEADEMVYFDNLQVTHERARLIEENHYYAYGLKIAGISSRKLPDAAEAHIKNEYLYNDKELIHDADLNWYDYGFRNYDPQIGRFPQLDPLTDDYPDVSPYHYAGNEPIGNIDFMGLGVETGLTSATAKSLQSVVVTGTRAAVQTTASVSGSLLRVGLAGVLAGSRLGAIKARGMSDALYNANTIGLHDAFGGNHLNDYSDFYEQEAYLQGRIAGDILSIAQGVSEGQWGGGVAITTGIETAGVGAAAGLVVALHGVGVSAIATADIANSTLALKKLYQLNASGAAASDAGKSSNKGGTEPNRIGQQGEAATKGGRSGFKEKYKGKVSGKDRISDFSTKTTIEETKNVKYQYWSTQLKDATARAKETGKTFILWIRKSTKISEQVKVQRRAGNVVIKFIPGSK